MLYAVSLSTAESTVSYPATVSYQYGGAYPVAHAPQAEFPAALHNCLMPAYKTGRHTACHGTISLFRTAVPFDWLAVPAAAGRRKPLIINIGPSRYGLSKSLAHRALAFTLAKPLDASQNSLSGYYVRQGSAELPGRKQCAPLLAGLQLFRFMHKAFLQPTVELDTATAQNGIMVVLFKSDFRAGRIFANITTRQAFSTSVYSTPLQLFQGLTVRGQATVSVENRQAARTPICGTSLRIDSPHAIRKQQAASLTGRHVLSRLRPVTAETKLPVSVLGTSGAASLIRLAVTAHRSDQRMVLKVLLSAQNRNKTAGHPPMAGPLGKADSTVWRLPSPLALTVPTRDLCGQKLLALQLTSKLMNRQTIVIKATKEARDGRRIIAVGDVSRHKAQALDISRCLRSLAKSDLACMLRRHVSVAKAYKPTGRITRRLTAYRPPGRAEMLCFDQASWDALLEEMYRTYGPKTDRLQLPPVDFVYSQAALYDQTTGVPYAPLTSPHVPEVMVQFPNTHPVEKYADVGLKIVDVHLWVLRDVISLLYRDRKEHTFQYEALPPGEAIRVALDRLHDKLRLHDYRRNEYRRAFRMARWYGEYAIVLTNDYWLIRSYQPWLSSEASHNQVEGLPAPDRPYISRADGWHADPSIPAYVAQGQNAILELSIGTLLPGAFSFTVEVQNTSGLAQARLTIDGQDKSYLLAGFARVEADLAAGDHSVVFEFLPGSPADRMELNSIKADYASFKSAEIVERPKEGINGAQAVDVAIHMLLHYYDLHHTGKTKGSRLFNLSVPQKLTSLINIGRTLGTKV